MAKVSICIPVYNDPAGFERLLRSVQEQLYTDYEVIVTDDSSDDSSEKIFEKYREAFAGHCYVYKRNEPSLGAAANWNEGISMAQGELLKIMHGDDCFTSPESLGAFVSLLDESPDCDLAFSGSRQKDHAAGTQYDRCISDAELDVLKKDYRNLYLGNTIGAPSAVIVRRSAAEKYGVSYDTALSWLVDSDYYLQILQNNSRFAFTKDPLVTIGISDSQMTERVGNDQKLLRREYRHVYRKFALTPENTGTDAYKKKCSAESHRALKQKIDTGIYLINKLQDKTAPLTTAAFWLALAIELGIVLVDISDLSVPMESYLFRLTFCLFFLKVLGSRYNKKELLYLIAFLALGAVSWKVSGRNEILRMSVFVASMHDLDKKKIAKAVFFGTAAGVLLLALLSVTGLFGVASLTQDFGHGLEIRYCLGIGHPNALHCIVSMLILLGLYLYGKKIGITGHVLLLVFDIVLYLMTRSNGGFVTAAAAILLSALTLNVRKCREGNAFYFAAELLFAAILVFSVLAAVFGYDLDILRLLDRPLTGRIISLWDTNYDEGTLATWHIFGSRRNQSYFDMGFVRLIYWYGTIPASILIGVIFAMFEKIRRKKDAAALVFLISLCIYTCLEAHIVSVYLLRNYVLILAAVYAPMLFGGRENESAD